MMRLASDVVHIEPPDLVRAAMAATGTETATDLARTLRMTSYSAPRNIKRWLDGVAQPDFEATLLLLDAAGLLASTPAAAKASRLTSPELADVLREIRALDNKIDVAITPRLDTMESELREIGRGRLRESEPS